MSRIIGRVFEKEVLDNALNSSRSELIAVYADEELAKHF